MRPRGTLLRRRTLAALITVALAAPAAAQTSVHWLQATLDHRETGATVRIFRDRDGSAWIRTDDLRRLGVAVPAVSMRWLDDGSAWVPADIVSDLLRIDEQTGRIHFSAPPLVVPATRPPTPAYLSPRPVPVRAASRPSTVPIGPAPATRPPTPAYLAPPPWPPKEPQARATAVSIPSGPTVATRPATPSYLSPPCCRPRVAVATRSVPVPPAEGAAPETPAGASAAPTVRRAPTNASSATGDHPSGGGEPPGFEAAPPPRAPAATPEPALHATPATPDRPPGSPRPLPAELRPPAPAPRPPAQPAPRVLAPRDEPGVEPHAPATAASPPLLDPAEPAATAVAEQPGVEPRTPLVEPVGPATPMVPGTPARAGIDQVREERFLVARNHVDTALSTLLLTDAGGRQWVRTTDLRALGIPLPGVQPLPHAGETYVPLDALALRVDIDRVGERLHLLDGQTPTPAEPALIADVVVNRQPLPEPQLLEWREGEPWLPPETIEAAGLLPPEGTADTGGWVPVSAIAGNHYVLGRDNLLLELTAPADRFATHHLDGRNQAGRSREAPPVAYGPPAVLLGYDFGAGRSSDGGTTTSAFADIGFSFGRTACSSQHLWRDDQRLTRLDTSCTTDWPERRLSLVLGDAASRDWGQGGAVRYGGIRLGTDFDLQPYLLTQPLLGLAGTARLPSVLEVWTDQQLSMRREIGPGRFVIDGLPTLSGRGEISAVVIDPLGRQTVITSPFYSDPSLMAAGLQDWAIEAGRLRTGAGLPEDDYGDPFAQFGLRRGVTNWWTTTVHAAGTRDLRVAGWNNHVRLGLLGVAELGVVGSRFRQFDGRGWIAGYSFRGRRWGFGVRQIRRDRDYVDLAWPEPGTAPRRELQANLNLRLGGAYASLGGVRRLEADGVERSFAQVAVGMPMLGGHLSVSGLRTFAPEAETRWMATWTVPLRWGNYAVWAEGGDRGSLRPGAAVQRNQPIGPGYGFRVAAQETDAGWRMNGDLRWRTNTLEGSVTAYDDANGNRADARVGGTLIWSEQGLHAASARDGSYALVKLPAAGVRVYRDQQVVATTGADGSAIVTRLRPFEINRLGVATDDLPLDTQIEVASLDLVPGRRQVMLADFGASARQSLTLRVRNMQGEVPAPGSRAIMLPEETPAQVGHDGLLYLEYATPPESIRIHLDDGEDCTIPGDGLPLHQAPGDIADILCRRIAP